MDSARRPDFIAADNEVRFQSVCLRRRGVSMIRPGESEVRMRIAYRSTPATTKRTPQLPTEPSCCRLRREVLNHGGNSFVTFLSGHFGTRTQPKVQTSDFQQSIA